MKTRSLLFAVAVLLVGSAPLQAQSIFLGFGATFPTGDYGAEDMTAADTGWLGIAGASFDIGEGGLWAYGEGFYGQNNHSDGNEKTNPYGAMAGLGYDFGSGEGVGVYAFGGAGLLVHKFSSEDEPSLDDSSSHFGYQAGAGLGIPLGGAVALFVEGRFMGASETTFFGALGGLSVDLGGGS